jgi:hypothetical protein
MGGMCFEKSVFFGVFACANLENLFDGVVSITGKNFVNGVFAVLGTTL